VLRSLTDCTKSTLPKCQRSLDVSTSYQSHLFLNMHTHCHADKQCTLAIDLCCRTVQLEHVRMRAEEVFCAFALRQQT
jgi:hypothetical protein